MMYQSIPGKIKIVSSWWNGQRTEKRKIELRVQRMFKEDREGGLGINLSC